MANELNYLRNQLNRAQVIARPGHRVIQTAMGRNLVVVDAPTRETNDRFTPKTEMESDPARREFVETDEVFHSAHRSVYALTALHDKIEATMKNDRLSDIGRAEVLREPQRSTIATLGTNGAAAAAAVNKRTADLQKLYEAPPVKDTVEAIADDRFLRHYQAQPPAGRLRLLGNADERVLLALRRSGLPLSSNEADLIDRGWRASVDRRDAVKSAALKAAVANAAWAQDVIQTAAQFALKHSGLSPAEVAEAAAGSGGEFLFGATRIAADAA